MFHCSKKVSGRDERISTTRRSRKKKASSLRNSVSRVLFIFLVNLIFAEGAHEVIIDGWEYESNATSTDECKIDETKCYSLTVDPDWIGDGECDGGLYNTTECCFDGGDCIEYNESNVTSTDECKIDEIKCSSLTVNPNWIGDGKCDGGLYNTTECCFDGGDCIEFNKMYPNCTAESWAIGDRRCDGGDYNTEVCGWDGGDCLGFNEKFPNCKVECPLCIGNGHCESEFNTLECGWDGGDCEIFNENASTSPFSPSIGSARQPSSSLPPSFSPTTILSDSLHRAKQNQESYIACIETDVFEWSWTFIPGSNRANSIEEAQKFCSDFEYMVFTCPTKVGNDDYYGSDDYFWSKQAFGFQMWCGNEEVLRKSKKVEASECRSNLIGPDPFEGERLCDGPNYHEKDGIWLGGAGRGAVYSVNYGFEKEKYENCLTMTEDEWRDRADDGCAWYDSNQTKRCFLDGNFYLNYHCGNAAKHICSSCMKALSEQFRSDHMEDMKVDVQANGDAKIDISGNSSHAIVVAQKQTGQFATIFELNEASAGFDMIPKFDISPKFDVSSVAISENGSHTAIGGLELLRVYQKTEQGYLIQKGRDIAIEEGLSVADISIDKDGDTLAFAALKYSESDFSYLAVNHVAIYRWDQNSARWNEEFRSRKSIPKTIDMDHDGKRVVISHFFNGHDGYEQEIKLFQYRDETSSWEEEERFRGHFGKISGNGRRIMTFFALDERKAEVSIYEIKGGDGNGGRVGDAIEIPKEDSYVSSINYRGNRFSVKVKRGFLANVIDVYEFTHSSTWERVLSIDEEESVKSAALEFKGLNMIRLVESKNGDFVDTISLWNTKQCPEPIQNCKAGEELQFSLNDCSSDCKKCSAGESFNSVIGFCVDCPVGTYSYQESENSDFQCKPCPGGLSTFGIGSPSLDFCRSECPFPIQSREFGSGECNICT